MAVDSGGKNVRYKYTGQEQDNTWFYNYHARLYDPLLGRFLSADTLVPSPGNPQSLNRYSYVLNNALRYTDPSGHAADAGGAYDATWEELYYAYDKVRQTVDPKAYYGTLQEYLAAKTVLYYNLWKEGPDSPNTQTIEAKLDSYQTRLAINGYYGTRTAVETAYIASGGESTVGFTLATGMAALGQSAFTGSSKPVRVEISRSKYPQAAQHIEDAQASGKPSILTIDRSGIVSRRLAALRGQLKISGMHLDEYPPAMFKEGGVGASVRAIDPTQNVGVGACIGNACRPYPDGTQVEIVVVP